MNRHCPLKIYHNYVTLPAPSIKIRKIARKIYAGEKMLPQQRIDVVLCSDYNIKKLNLKYRGKNYATDVLSFPFKDDDFLGEIYISLQRAKIQAARFKISYDDEIVRLFVHGMFHLIGFDHKTTKERDIMEQMEQQYFIVKF